MTTLLVGLCAMMASAQTLPYQNHELSAAQRADDLLGPSTRTVRSA